MRMLKTLGFIFDSTAEYTLPYRFVESEAALRSCLGLCGDVYGRESLELASCYNSLGQLLATTGRCA